MGGTVEHKASASQLLDISHSLEFVRIDDLDAQRVDLNHSMNGIQESFLFRFLSQRCREFKFFVVIGLECLGQILKVRRRHSAQVSAALFASIPRKGTRKVGFKKNREILKSYFILKIYILKG